LEPFGWFAGILHGRFQISADLPLPCSAVWLANLPV
jgi:hypothetical protein